MDDQLRQRVRAARGKFVAMAGTYTLGVVNDQFYKQAAMLLAVAAGMTSMQGNVMRAFALPWMLFAASAGWLSDRFSKRHVVIGAKVMELAAMTCGAIGIITLNWWLVVVMAFVMAWQSTIFSPALNGSIPELYPREYVMRANGVLKVFTTVGILAGIALAGPVLEIGAPADQAAATQPAGEMVADDPAVHADNPTGRWAVGLGVMGVALVGVAISLFVPKRPPADRTARFPWTGPWDTLVRLWHTRKDRLLWRVIWADVFIWSAGSVQVMLINVMGVREFGLTKSQTSYLVAAEVLGIALGGALVGYLAKGERWHRVLMPSALGMAIAMGAITAVPFLSATLQIPTLLALLVLTGATGGMFMIPCEAFIQMRPAATERGSVIASANFAIFGGIAASSFVSDKMNEHLLPTVSFGIMAGLSVVVAVVLVLVLPKKPQAQAQEEAQP